jgi:NAD(P)H dehydrogenase (quinone)
VWVRIAVTGASGRLGGQVVRLLAADETHHVVAVSRRGLRTEGQPAHVTTAAADYMDLPALRNALRDVDTLVFVSSDGEAERVLIHHDHVARAAADCGVPHVVALSSLDADLTSPFCYAVINGRTEQMLLDRGCTVTVARASLFTEFFLSFLTEAATSGQVRVPAADGRVSLVSREDVGRCLAAMAVAAPTGRHHDLTGPEPLDLATVAAVAEGVWRTPVRYVDVTPAEHHVEMARSGLEPWWCYAFSSMFASVRGQRWDAVSDEVLRWTGRPPAPLAEVLASHGT